MNATATGARGDESRLLARLSLEQKVRLLTGADAWTLYAINAVGLRSMVVSDGPSGVRGRRFDPGNPSSSLPCPVALGATWDEGLVSDVARALGEEARSRGVDVLLAPTVNIVRTPLSGRGFECFSEDPVLTARMAVAYVRGVQDSGVGATAKHYVGNDSETDRRTYDARISQQVLRELYLAPFEACVFEADVALVMAAYNSVNGHSMTANPTLLRDLLKDEWGFQGVVVSDWSATRTTEATALAGLDLVMPGPRGPWGDQLVAAVRGGAVPEVVVDDKVVRLLRLARRVGALNGMFDGESPDGAGAHHPAAQVRAGGTFIDPLLLREVTSRSFVLLRNQDGLLPVKPDEMRRVALIGPNAVEPQTQGGGSVRVLPVVRPGLADSLLTLGEFDAVDVHQGCLTWATIPQPRDGSLRDPVSGAPGVHVEVRDADGTLRHDASSASSVLTWWDGLPAAVHLPGSELVIRGRYRASVDGPHVIGVAGVGVLSIAIDGSVLAEATTLHPTEIVEAFSRPPELRVPIELHAGSEVEIRAAYRPNVRGPEAGFVTMRLGVTPRLDENRLLDEAISSAREADVAVIVVGSAEGTESEGYDRDTLSLPGRQDELVRRVAAVQPNTVVIVNSGMPVLMPWVDDVAAVIQAWLPGQAFGEALTDCLLGVVEPGGRLPISIPRGAADSPVLDATPKGGELAYSEGLLVGYRGYDRSGREPLFCFGHGLGYTQWSYESLVLGAEGSGAEGLAEGLNENEELPVTVTVRNTGGRRGREVVQVYLEAPDDDPSRPLRTLAGFATVDVDPGEVGEVPVVVPARAFARFDPDEGDWVWRPGTYNVRVGRSSRDLRLSSPVELRLSTSRS
ncbi:MAG: glycoside hydrolase family 3 C-terminal domain-containing protein [Candidatus Dormiibacterota bacterium]